MANTPPPVVEEARGSFFSNIVALIGLVILVVIVIWGLIHLVGLSQGWFSSLFNRTPTVAVTAPMQVTSGTPFQVSWKYSSNERGNYAFLYQCKSGLVLKNNGISIPCGTSYTVGATTTLSVTPVLSQVSSTTVPLSVVFLPNATSSKRAEGSASVLVRAAASQTVTNLPNPVITKPVTETTKPAETKPTQTAKPADTAPRYVSPANLSVRIIALGVIDRNTGMFVNRAPAYYDDIAAAQFDIQNVGGSRSGTYYFSANLPTAGGYVYNSPAQAPLEAGDHVINTLRWTNSAQTGTFTVALTGDTQAADNYASATIAPSYAAQPAYNSYYAPSQYYPQYAY